MVMPQGNYRKIAQNNWGLTDEQMKGMHVHHRTPRSKGGTDEASNLYVCSPWFHANVWHSQGEFIENASKGGQISRDRKLGWHDPEVRLRGASSSGKLKTPKQQAARRKLFTELGKKRAIAITLRHIATGQTHSFASCKEACEELNLNKGNLSSVMTGRRVAIGGFELVSIERRN